MDTMMLNREWSNRPNDQRFLSMTELHAYNEKKRESATQRGVALDHLRVVAQDGGMYLAATGPVGARLNNWAFGQLCQRASAPAGYLRSLPAELAVMPLQWSLEHKREDAKLYLGRNEAGEWSTRAITSDSYGRIFDAEMSEALIRNLDLNIWQVPAASYAANDPKRATTLYASDRDCFVALVDPSRPIMEPGTNSPLYRGIIARNSEVGAATFELLFFLYRYICDNRIIWGGQEVGSIKIRHSSGAPMRFLREAKPQLRAYLEAGTNGTIEAIRAVQKATVGDDTASVKSWLAARGFTKAQVTTIVANAEKEQGNPRSRWNLVQGITAMAQDCPFGDERLDLEKAAAKILR